MKQVTILLIGTAILFTSCAPRIPFTQKIREQYRLTDEEIKSIQFYASHDIVLQRGESSGKSKETTEGTLTVTNSKSVDQVLIKAGTPGIVEQVVDQNKVMVSFEDGGNKTIIFGDPFDNKGSYKLLAANWKNNRGSLTYNGKEYVTSASASNTYITFKMKKLNKFMKDEHVAKGRKL